MLASHINRKNIFPAFSAAIISLLLLRGGVFTSFLFLVPFGYLSFRYNAVVLWTSIIIGILAGFIQFIVLTILQFSALPAGIAGFGFTDFIFHASMILIFAFILSPPFTSFYLKGYLRLIAGSVLGAIIFILIFYRQMESEVFIEQIGFLFTALSGQGADVVENAIIGEISTETILAMMRDIMFRGAALLSCVLIFFTSRLFGSFFARLVMRERGKPVFIGFYVNTRIIWILSGSLILLVLTSIMSMEIPEILLWNILLICIMMYLAQGLGILQFFLSRPAAPPFLKLLAIVLFFIFIISPVLNTVLLAGLALLGIAENWLPIRNFAIKGPPSTPEAGDE